MENSQYEKDGVLSIIKNKQFMLPSLKSLLSDIRMGKEKPIFVDPFSGSGVVSRVAKTLNMDVKANDAEYFSYIVNSVYLKLHHEDIASMFSFMGGIDAYFSYLNMSGLYGANGGAIGGKSFVSAYYAPQDTHTIERGKERLFYSRENALFLDAVRNDVETSYLEGKLQLDEVNLIISSILYQAMRSANISGTFTSYHKHIVGSSSSVKKRVSEPITLLIPHLLQDNSTRCEVYQQDALEFVKTHKGDIFYLDPPSHPQQYSSAYHLLNSIALWDDFAPSNKLNKGGTLEDVSGIRDDWKKTKSPFCSLKKSYKAMVSLMNRIDAPHIILSYPSDGILSIQEIYEILSLRKSSFKLVSIPKEKKGGRATIQNKGVSENLYILGDGVTFSLLLPEQINIATLIGRIDALKESNFFPIPEPIDGYSFIKGVMIDSSLSFHELSKKSEKELKEIAQLLEEYLIEDSFLAVKQLIDLYITHFSSLTNREKMKMEKRAFMLLRYIKGYEKERIGEVHSYLYTNKTLRNVRDGFVEEIEKIIPM